MAILVSKREEKMYLTFFVIDLGVMAGFYCFLSRRKKILGLSLGMNLAMAMSLFFSLFLSFVLMETFPFYYVQIVCVTTLLSMLVGGLFGGLKDEQTILSGLANGMIMGLMSPMAAGVSLYDQEVFYLIQILFLATIISLSFENKRWRKSI